MLCQHCAGPLPQVAQASARYCSNRCRQAAYRRRKKDGAAPAPAPVPATAVVSAPVAGPPGPGGECPRVSVKRGQRVEVELTPEAFERMMGGDGAQEESYEDLLRFARGVLKAAMAAPSTSANALAPLARQLLAVGKELDAAGRVGDVFADDGSLDEEFSLDSI